MKWYFQAIGLIDLMYLSIHSVLNKNLFSAFLVGVVFAILLIDYFDITETENKKSRR